MLAFAVAQLGRLHWVKSWPKHEQKIVWFSVVSASLCSDNTGLWCKKEPWRDLCACRRQQRIAGVVLSAIHLCPQTLLSVFFCSSFLFLLFFSIRDHYFQPRRYFTGIKPQVFFFFPLSAVLRIHCWGGTADFTALPHWHINPRHGRWICRMSFYCGKNKCYCKPRVFLLVSPTFLQTEKSLDKLAVSRSKNQLV